VRLPLNRRDAERARLLVRNTPTPSCVHDDLDERGAPAVRTPRLVISTNPKPNMVAVGTSYVRMLPRA
jgi:hypothetical protein